MQHHHNKSNDYNHVINSLQDYMLTNTLIEKSSKSITPIHKNVKVDVLVNVLVNPVSTVVLVVEKDSHITPIEVKVELDIKSKVINPFFYPEQKDQLFWCYYIIKNGFSAYEYPGNTSFINEKNEKFKCIELLREKKGLLKSNKIKNIKEDIEDELANKEKIGMKTFIALCVVSELNILFIHKRKCFEFINESLSTNPIYVIHNITMPTIKYCYETVVSPEKISDYRTNYFKWESVDKPIRAISAYKSEELLELCKRLLLDTTSIKKLTKKDLYDLLITNI